MLDMNLVEKALTKEEREQIVNAFIEKRNYEVKDGEIEFLINWATETIFRYALLQMILDGTIHPEIRHGAVIGEDIKYHDAERMVERVCHLD